MRLRESERLAQEAVDAALVRLVAQTPHRRVPVIGRRSTHRAIAVRSGLPPERAVREPWTWQPGWEYE